MEYVIAEGCKVYHYIGDNSKTTDYYKTLCGYGLAVRVKRVYAFSDREMMKIVSKKPKDRRLCKRCARALHNKALHETQARS
jgi:hypothetical protein